MLVRYFEEGDKRRGLTPLLLPRVFLIVVARSHCLSIRLVRSTNAFEQRKTNHAVCDWMYASPLPIMASFSASNPKI